MSLTRSAVSSMRKRFIAIGLIAVLCGVAGILAPTFLSTASLTHDIELQIQRTTGLSTRIAGPPHFTLLPQPIVEVTNIDFADPSGALQIKAQSMTGYLRLLPLLAGRFEIARASLANPLITIDLDGRPMSRDGAIGRAAEAKPSEASADGYMRLGSVDVVGGRARLESRAAYGDQWLEDVNVSIDWPNLAAAAGIKGHLKFHDERVDIAAWFDKPLELLRGAESGMTLKLDSSVATLSTKGTFSAGSRLQYRGNVEATVASLRRLAELTGHSFPHHGSFADLDFKCDANVAANTAALSNLRLRLDGNEYEGTLAIQTSDAKPLVSGTLATNYLDLAPFLTGLPDPLAPEHHWNAARIDAADLGFADLDLRVSATRLRLAQMELRDAALSLITHTGGMDLTLAEATANQGKVKGRVSLAVQDGGGLALRATGNVKNLRLRPVPINVDGHHELSGSLSGTLALDSEGTSVSELVQHVGGKIHLDLDSGALTRLDLESLLTLGTSRKQNGEADANAPLDGASVGLKIAVGRAEIENGRLRTKGMNLLFGGSTNLAERTFDLWALNQPPQDADVPPDQELTRVGLTGSWDAPRLTLDHVARQNQPLRLHDDKPKSMSFAPAEE